MAYEFIQYTMEEGVAYLTFNRPQQKNAISIQLSEEVEKVLDEVAQNAEIKVLVISGGNDIFSAGMDLKAGRTPLRRGASIFSIVNSINACEKPTIASISGYTLGGGCEIVLSCDLRIASETAVFGFPEINMGVMPGAGGTQRLPRLIGAARAKELMFTGERFNAQDAYRMGIVNKVVPVASLVDETKKLAKVIAGKDVNALKIIKRCIDDGLQMDLATGLQYSNTAGIGLMGLKKAAAAAATPATPPAQPPQAK
ncbi:MAG: enoyl-CoA hydratase/isomerase family protein [Chloroflexi bacterium]|nr:enoyl-CoA hydratase/isomerase family protein [Chloroflexota bacterium]